MQKNFDVIVIGGGASGMMAAGRAGERGKRVLLLEKNSRLGVKLSITGGGRCNIFNGETDPHQLLENYGEAKKFLYSSFSQFGVEESRAFFEHNNLPLKEEAQRRIFPQSEQATDVVRVLKEQMQKVGVAVRCDVEVLGLTIQKDKVVGVQTNLGIFSAESYILATGGTSHPETGSTGDGFLWLSQIHHTVKDPIPSVVPLAVKESWVKSLAGITFEQAK